MNQDTKEDLVISSASKVHQDWCDEELKGFWGRAAEAKKSNLNSGDALREACLKNGKVRNEVIIDVPQINSYGSEAENIFSDFNAFKSMINAGAIEVKRFTGRDLTPEEISERLRTGDYKDGQENILRDFLKLSTASKKENLDAAIGAANVYVQLSEAGITIEQMKNNPEIRNLIGVAIHADWLIRNMDHPNDSLKVPYNALDDWTKGQDLTVFDALLSKVNDNYDKYSVNPVPGIEIPDYQEMEKNALNNKHV